MDTADPANVPAPGQNDYGVSGVPKSGRSAIDLAAAIGAACNTPHPTTGLPDEEAEGSDPTTPCDPEPGRTPYADDSGPDVLSDGPSATPANTEASARGQQGEESVVNGDIDLCRRAVLLQPQEEDVCSICLDEFTQEDPAQATACGHLYHLQCVMQWAQRSRECPLCFRALQLQDAEMNSLLPFGEYVAPPGPGSSTTTSVSVLAQHMYGVESWELEQLLQRLALSSQQPRSHHHSSGHRRHHRSRRHRDNSERVPEGDEAAAQRGEAQHPPRDNDHPDTSHPRHRSSSRNHHGGSSRSVSALTSGEAVAGTRASNSNAAGASGSGGSSRDSAQAASAEGRYPRRSAEPQRRRLETGTHDSGPYHRRRHSDVHGGHPGLQSPAANSSAEAISSTFDLKAASIMLKNRWNAMGLKCREMGRATRALWRGAGGDDPGSGGPSTSRH